MNLVAKASADNKHSPEFLEVCIVIEVAYSCQCSQIGRGNKLVADANAVYRLPYHTIWDAVVFQDFRKPVVTLSVYPIVSVELVICKIGSFSTRPYRPVQHI
jgi:hypothetical protein